MDSPTSTPVGVLLRHPQQAGVRDDLWESKVSYAVLDVPIDVDEEPIVADVACEDILRVSRRLLDGADRQVMGNASLSLESNRPGIDAGLGCGACFGDY